MRIDNMIHKVTFVFVVTSFISTIFCYFCVLNDIMISLNILVYIALFIDGVLIVVLMLYCKNNKIYPLSKKTNVLLTILFCIGAVNVLITMLYFEYYMGIKRGSEEYELVSIPIILTIIGAAPGSIYKAMLSLQERR